MIRLDTLPGLVRVTGPGRVAAWRQAGAARFDELACGGGDRDRGGAPFERRAGEHRPRLVISA